MLLIFAVGRGKIVNDRKDGARRFSAFYVEGSDFGDGKRAGDALTGGIGEEDAAAGLFRE